MLLLAAICLVVFSFIAAIYFTVPVFIGAPGRELLFAIAFVVEFMALFSVAIGLVIYDTTGRRQLLYVALGMVAQFVGDGVNLVAPVILAHLEPGWLWALFSDVSWLVLSSRVVANIFFLISVLRANASDNICRSEQLWTGIPVILVCVVAVQLVLSLLSPNFAYDASHIISHILILPLLVSTVLAMMVLSGYLMRVVRRPSAFEVLFTIFLMNSMYHHMAFILFDDTGRDLTAAYLMPSRLFSYGFVLVAMVAALRDLYRSASQASSAKSAFLATMSHEIRTPLNGVLGMAQLLRQTNLNQIQRERVNAILSSGRALMSLLNDILDMSKIEAGHADIEIRPFRPYDVTCDLSSAILALTQEKNLKLVWDDKILRNRIFMGDEVRFRQVLWNLLSNAVKFTQKGTIQLVVEYDPSRAGGRIQGSLPSEVYRFSVSDTGIGIAPERQERIFQAFTQGDSSTMRQFGGTGLGLSISQNLIRMMGGHIGLHSVPGQGTRFDCWLPFDVHNVAQDEAEHSKTGVEENPIALLADKRILVAEDNEINANVMAAFLERMGLKVDIAGNGRLAVQAFQKNKYDAILMDAHMPVLDGEGAARHIREIEREIGGGRIPIIGVTADVFADRQRDFLAAGMDEVLTKPIEERRLYASLIHHLRGRGDLLDLAEIGSLMTAGRVETNPVRLADIPWQTLAEIRAAARLTTSPEIVSEDVVKENAKAARWPETVISQDLPPKQDLPPPAQQYSARRIVRDPDDLLQKGIATSDPAEAEEMVAIEEVASVKDQPETAGTSDKDRMDDPDTENEVVLVNRGRMQEMLDALGRDQMITLINMLPEAFHEECERMTGAIATNDRVTFQRAAHSIKGMAGNLAADEVARRARDLEYYDGPLDQIPSMIDDLEGILQETMQKLLDVTEE
ncbi:ATP-binding protein [Thalassospira sp. TSL5-1]|uniref:hybrid sensor histidine kinase/response regulator n=1 Tax=Thalassospira sp. TSL5-1 TaxID=1544451 RepID=UPI00093A9953|nr:ATP-binding protein [Thalassospira sp. TSL5-1]